jgi:uncharacterized SAM-binding protein YcdF (DUF218 family)
MFYYLSKVIWFLIQPSSVIFLSLLTGFLLVLVRRRSGLPLMAIGLAGILIFGFSPVPRWMLGAVERSGMPTAEERGLPVVGTILLGGFVDTGISSAVGHMTTTDSADRLLAAIMLTSTNPDQPLIMSGGSNPIIGGLGEAELTGDYLARAGLNIRNLYLENKSRNTHQNATLVKQLIESKMPELSDKRWRLVTSAFHMKRSRAVFEKAGMDVVAYPADYRSEDSHRQTWRGYKSLVLGLRDTDIAVKEWIGYFAYWMTGRI